MEPFIIEELLVFLALVSGAGLAAFWLVKFGVNWWAEHRSRTEHPRQRIEKIISESETSLSNLQHAIADLKRNHARMQAAVSANTKEAEHLRSAEEKSRRRRECTAEFRAIVRRRMEAESNEMIARQSEDMSRKALDDIERKHHELETKLSFARAAAASLNARLVAAEIKQEIHDDFGNGTDAAIEELESAAIACESRAESFEETSRFFKNCAARISEDDVTAEIARMTETKKEKHHDHD